MLHGALLAAVDAASPAANASVEKLHGADLTVLVAYLAAVLLLGLWLGRRGNDADEFMAAGRSLPGWAVGLSMFGSYVSSISFLANAGEAYRSNWNALVFSLTAPIAAPIAILWFMPFYRRQGEVSAYEHLEARFGPWARTYAVACFLLTQMARMGTIVYLLGVAVAPLTNWSVPSTVIVTGLLMTFYTITGGIKSAVWVGVLQSAVLIAGIVICVVSVIARTPGGISQIIEVGAKHEKFGLGEFDSAITPALNTGDKQEPAPRRPIEPTLWVMVLFGLTTHLSNLGVDQGFIQRYITASSNREAAKSIWITALLYVPAAAVFFFIGTGLFVLYSSRPELLPAGMPNDKVFPHFIATQLPAGMAGLVVASLFAASMDSNLSSMATLTLCDIYKRYFRPQADERESMRVLRISMIGWGLAGIGVGLAMIGAKGALDAWWKLAGLFSGGVLGLFLLGLVSRRAGNAAGAIGVLAGACVTIWLALPNLVDIPPEWQPPFHAHMTIVLATLTIFLVGIAASSWRKPEPT